MKKNNKGFTMIELLAVITIMGILATVAVPAVYRYVTKARGTSKDTMLKSSYEAAENFIIKEGIIIDSGSTKKIPLKDLVEEQYLEMLIDPTYSGSSEKARCELNSKSVVEVKSNGMINGISDYSYKVTIVCPQSGTFTKTFPE